MQELKDKELKMANQEKQHYFSQLKAQKETNQFIQSRVGFMNVEEENQNETQKWGE